MKQLFCPISKDKINEQIIRLNAIIGILLVLGGFAFNTIYPLLLLTADFFIRAFLPVKLSPVTFVSHWLTNTLKLGNKLIDKAPKIFAARLGFLMLLSILLLFIFNLQLAYLILGGIFILLAGLEFVFCICIGCIIYTFVVLPFYR